ncbi:MAG: hypothetical protein JHC95_04500 [Solirubrobacteraceae bacterium]|nr:hypothetical protein [Solirubrobacteraceae bacterium]
MPNLKLKRKGTRKAAKATARHAAKGTASKVKRSPIRSATLLLVGILVGSIGTRLATGHHQESSGAAA